MWGSVRTVPLPLLPISPDDFQRPFQLSLNDELLLLRADVVVRVGDFEHSGSPPLLPSKHPAGFGVDSICQKSLPATLWHPHSGQRSTQRSSALGRSDPRLLSKNDPAGLWLLASDGNPASS